MSHIWMSHVTHMNGSCHTYGWVMSHIWRSHFTHMNESCHTYKWVMSHIWVSHVTQMIESCLLVLTSNSAKTWHVSCMARHGTQTNKSRHTYKCGMARHHSHISTSHVTHTHELHHTYACVMARHHTRISTSHELASSIEVRHTYAHIQMRHGTQWTHSNESWHTYEHIQTSHGTHMNTSKQVMAHTWMSHMKHMKRPSARYSKNRWVSCCCFFHKCDVAHSYMCHDSFACVHMCAMTRVHVFICVPWLVWRCDVTRWYVGVMTWAARYSAGALLKDTYTHICVCIYVYICT